MLFVVLRVQRAPTPPKLAQPSVSRSKALEPLGGHPKRKDRWSLPLRDGGQKRHHKETCDKDFAELSGELSVGLCQKTLVLLGNALKLCRKFFGAARAILGFCGSLLAPEIGCV